MIEDRSCLQEVYSLAGETNSHLENKWTTHFPGLQGEGNTSGRPIHSGNNPKRSSLFSKARFTSLVHFKFCFCFVFFLPEKWQSVDSSAVLMPWGAICPLAGFLGSHRKPTASLNIFKILVSVFKVFNILSGEGLVLMILIYFSENIQVSFLKAQLRKWILSQLVWFIKAIFSVDLGFPMVQMLLPRFIPFFYL